MKVQEIASKQVVACAPDTTLSNAGWLMWENDCGVLPILEDGKATGVITDRDIAIATATKSRTAADIPVREVANGQLHSCRSNDDIQEALKTMKSQRVRRIPVVDAENRLIGILLSMITASVPPICGLWCTTLTSSSALRRPAC